jgi:hypothetical protein
MGRKFIPRKPPPPRPKRAMYVLEIDYPGRPTPYIDTYKDWNARCAISKARTEYPAHRSIKVRYDLMEKMYGDVGV